MRYFMLYVMDVIELHKIDNVDKETKEIIAYMNTVPLVYVEMLPWTYVPKSYVGPPAEDFRREFWYLYKSGGAIGADLQLVR